MRLPDETPVALVTGTSSGIGLLTSMALAKAGFSVVATVRNWDKRHVLIREAEKAGVRQRIDCTLLDVTDHAAVDRLVDKTVKQYGRIDVLVNNAGLASGGFVEEVPMETWRKQMETNFFGLVAVTKAVIPVMRKRGHGKIINISSISGRLGFPAYGPYAASKFAVEGFSESLRLELLPFGVYVTLIEPGAYQTNIWEKGFASMPEIPGSPYREIREAVIRYSRRTAESALPPHEVVRTVVNVATSSSPKFRYVVGRGPKLALSLKALLPWRLLERVIGQVIKKY